MMRRGSFLSDSKNPRRPIVFSFLRKRRWRASDLYYYGNLEDYAKAVFKRYGKDGKKPTQRGHFLLILGFTLSFLVAFFLSL